MKPRHFWWLVETIETRKTTSSLSAEERKELTTLLEMAERGEF